MNKEKFKKILNMISCNINALEFEVYEGEIFENASEEEIAMQMKHFIKTQFRLLRLLKGTIENGK